MRAIIRFFLDNYKLTFVLSAFIMLFGVDSMNTILREKMPLVNLGEAKIMTYYPGATSEEVEIEVTKKIEDQLKEIKGIKLIKAVSQINMSIIRIKIDIDNFDQEEVLDDVQKALQKVAGLPATASKPEYMEINTEEIAVIEFAVVGSNKNRERDAFVDFLEDELKDLKGVLKVTLSGYADREFSVRLRLNDLKKYNVGIDEITEALRVRNVTIPAGSLKSYKNQAFVKIDGKTKIIQDLENVLIRTNFEGKKVYLKDLATVEDSYIDQESFTKINGKDATLVAVKKQAGVDTIKLANAIRERVDSVAKLANSPFEIVYYVNEAKGVQDKFDIVISNIVMGGAIVLFFLLIFLPGKIGIMTTVGLPITILATLGYMNMTGMNLDTITMLAMIIAVGMLVDNSIVVSETFSRFVEEGMSIKEAAFEAVAQFWVPMFATTMTTVCAFLPMFLTKGIMGLFISGIPIIVSISLMLSLGECFFFLPARLKLIGGSIINNMRKRKAQGKSTKDWFGVLTEKFENLVYVCVVHRYMSGLAFIGIVLFSFFMLSLNSFTLFPNENVLVYTVRYETNIGDSLEKTSKVTETLVKDLEKVIGKDNIDNIVAYIGQSGTGLTDDLQQSHHNAELKIHINEEKSFDIDYLKILEDVRNFPKPYLTKFEILKEEAGPPVGRPVEANFRSNNEKALYEVVNYVFDKFKSTEGILDLETNDYRNDDEIFIKLNYDKVARLGLNTSSIGNDIKASIEGINIANLTIGNDDFYIKVRFNDSYQENEKDLAKISIRDPRGNLIPLTQIATITRKSGSTMKHRYNFKKTITIRANINEKIITALGANKIINNIYSEIKEKYPEVVMEFGGEQESATESFESLIIATKYAVILIFAFLVFIFGSYLSPIIIMTTILLGVLGFAVAFWAEGRPLSFLAFIGVIGLAGVVVNVGVILISFIETLRKENFNKFTLEQILAKASGLRLRAVVSSSLTTIAGLLPTAYGVGGRDANLMPLTLAMAWGMISSTILSLIWIPCMYALIEDMTRFFRKVKVEMRRRKRLRANNSRIRA